MPETHANLKTRAARFKGLAAKLDASGKKEDARHYRKLMKRMQRRARLCAPKKSEAPAGGEAKPAEAAKS